MWEMHRERVLGGCALTLIFFASAAFTWSSFTDASRSARVGDGVDSTGVATILPAAEVAAAAVSTELAPDVFASAAIAAKSAIIIDVTENKVLYALNPDTQLPLASLTKVPLVLVVTQVLPLDTIITITEGVFPFATGAQWKLSDIIDYTLAISSNQGADILAAEAEVSIREQYKDAPAYGATLWRMNELARELDLDHTYFLNATGLDEGPTQSGAYGTARDMATLFAYAAATSPDTFSATRVQSFTIQSLGGARATAINTDAALPAIPGLLVGKTGYTTLAGGNLAVVYEEGGRRIVAVVLGSTQTGRFEDMKALITLTNQTIAANR